MRNDVANAAMGNVLDGVRVASYWNHVHWAPMARFFVSGSVLQHYIKDTHQAYTYYAALRASNGRINASDIQNSFVTAAPRMLAALELTDHLTQTPTNPNTDEINKLKAFATIGDNLENLGWELDDYSTWDGVLWDSETENRVTSIDISHKFLTGTLDLSDFSGLRVLECQWNNLTAINLNGAGELEELYCNNNNLTALDVSTNTKLVKLYCGFNQLQTLDLSDNPLLTWLCCEENYLDVYDGSDLFAHMQVVLSREGWVGNTAQRIKPDAVFNSSDMQQLIAFAQQNDNLEKLNWDLAEPQEWAGITWAYDGDEYRVTEINVSELELTGTLNLSNMDSLTRVICNRNNLETLDASNCVNLQILHSHNAGLFNLSITNSVNIVSLDIENNYLALTPELLEQLMDLDEKEGSRIVYHCQYIFAEVNEFNGIEYNVLSTFANINDNLEMLGWDLEKPGEWDGVTWEFFEDTYRIRHITLQSKPLSGSLDLSKFHGLVGIDCKITAIMGIRLPDIITTIPNSMFYDCNELTNITLPISITEIGDSAFYGCNNLTRIIIPRGVVSIGSNAFSYSANLYDVFIDSITPPTVGEDAFSDIKPGARVVVPREATAFGSEGSLWNGLVVTTFRLGDINGDGVINVADLVYLRRYLVGMAGYELNPAMDVNDDGVVDAADLTMLRRILVGRPL
jgi:hypothetical protein